MRRNYSILSGSGYIIGPIISGYMFVKGFGYTGLLAAFLTMTNLVLLMKVTKGPKDIDPKHKERSVLQKTFKTVVDNVKYLKKSNPEKHWDILLLKYLFASSVMIFFSKFTQILKYNYNGDSIMMGYTASYINTLVFAATYYVALIKPKTEAYPVIFVSELSFFFIDNFNAVCVLRPLL